MEALLTSTVLVAIAEMGDNTLRSSLLRRRLTPASAGVMSEPQDRRFWRPSILN